MKDGFEDELIAGCVQTKEKKPSVARHPVGFLSWGIVSAVHVVQSDMPGAGDKHRETRPSPGQSAALFKPGTRRRGNDGAMYVVSQAANGVRRWVRDRDRDRDQTGPDPAQAGFELVLQPQVHVAGRARSAKLMLADVVGPHALRVVRSSLHGVADRVGSVLYDMGRGVYVVHAWTWRPDAFPGEARENYGELAADTWMEGDITIAPDVELHLRLLRVGML